MYLRELHTNLLALAARLLIQEGVSACQIQTISYEIRHILNLDPSWIIYFLSLGSFISCLCEWGVCSMACLFR